MDLDKLKKIAKEKSSFALRKLIGVSDYNAKEAELSKTVKPNTADETDSADSKEHTETPAETLRFNINEFIDKIKNPAHQPENESPAHDDEDTHVSEPEEVSEAEESKAEIQAADHEQVNESSDEIAEAVIEECEDLLGSIKESLNDVKNSITSSVGGEMSSLSAKLDTLEAKLSKLDDVYEQTQRLINLVDMQNSEISKNIININGKLNTQDGRLSEINSSLGSVSKLNDSVFDLKNSQLNTRKAVSELAVSFVKLKKKMTTSVVLISIISVILVLLEVVNLLAG